MTSEPLNQYTEICRLTIARKDTRFPYLYPQTVSCHTLYSSHVVKKISEAFSSSSVMAFISFKSHEGQSASKHLSEQYVLLLHDHPSFISLPQFAQTLRLLMSLAIITSSSSSRWRSSFTRSNAIVTAWFIAQSSICCCRTIL